MTARTARSRGTRLAAWAVAAACLLGTALGPVAAAASLDSAPLDAAVAASAATALAAATQADGGSAQTVTIPADHPDASLRGLEVTVSQTEGLVNQAVQVTWRGWQPGVTLGANSGNYFVQVMQCWADEDPEVPGLPDRRSCVWGTRVGYGNREARTATSGSNQVPFLAVTGEEISTYDEGTWSNQFWTQSTTNAVAGVIGTASGTGEVNFELQTGAESPGLGCGDRITTTTGEVEGRHCWLVVVPRGAGVTTESPMNPAVWATALAFKMDFRPAGQACEIGSSEVRIAGSELLVDASLAWQRQLCREGTAFAYSQLGEPEARRQMLTGSAGAPQAGVAVQPFGADDLAEGQSVDYAPMAVTGAVVGFNLDTNVDVGVPPAVFAKLGMRIDDIKLTPRLVAKLLTQSYRGSLSQALSGKRVNGVFYDSYPASEAYRWGETNPHNLFGDPEFQRLNPGANYWKDVGGLGTQPMVSLDNSDVASAVWSWVLADEAARAWLAGRPDEDGMRVNPYFATTPELNASGQAMELPRTGYPLADPWCDQYPLLIPGLEGGKEIRSERCATDITPYVSDMHQGAQYALAGVNPAKSVWDGLASPPAWKGAPRQRAGEKLRFTITDAASASRYGLSVATLCSGAGTNCVKPSQESLLAAVPSMTSIGGTRVRQLEASAVPEGAYPLTLVPYLAVLSGDEDGDGTDDRPAELREALATYIAAGVTTGQVPGGGDGQLPGGYAPLPEGLRAEALAVATRLTAAQAPLPDVSLGPVMSPGASPGTVTSTSTPLGGGTAQFTVPGTTDALGLPGADVAPVLSAGTGAPAGAADPLGAGQRSNPLAGSATPADPSGLRGLLLPGLLGAGLLIAVTIPLLGRFRRGDVP